MAVDDSYTKSLLHFNGADQSTVFTDESGKIWTASGAAKIITAQSKFGGSSYNLNGTYNNFVSTPDHDDWTLGPGDFTIDAHIYGAGSGTIWSHKQANFTEDYLRMSGGDIFFLSYRDISTCLAYYSYTWFPASPYGDPGHWHHVALVRHGTDLLLFIDGDLKTWTAINTPIGSNDLYNISGTVQLGKSYDSFGMDEFRFSKVARWTANFTPPTEEYVPIPPPIFDFASAPLSIGVSIGAELLGSVVVDAADTPLALASSMSADQLISKSTQFDFTLPLLGFDFHGLTGGRGSLAFDLPLLDLDINVLAGGTGNLALDLPLPQMSFQGGGYFDFTLPALELNINGLVGSIGHFEATLPALAFNILSHADGIGQLNFVLPKLVMDFTVTQNGFGSFAFNLPPLGMSIHGLTGGLSTLNFELPRLKLDIHSYQSVIARLDFILPALTMDFYGRVHPVIVTYRGIVINTKNMAVTEYEGFDFNSLASIGNVHLGANEKGIHALRGARIGPDPINSRIKSGILDFGKGVLSIPRDVWLSLRAEGKLILKVRVDEGEEYPYGVPGLKDALHEERAKLGRGLKGRFFEFALENKEGADFDLSKMSIMVDALRDRKR